MVASPCGSEKAMITGMSEPTTQTSCWRIPNRANARPCAARGMKRGTRVALAEPVSPGIWEKFCYLEEGDYYLVFALRARNRAAFNSSLATFEALVTRYHE